MPKAKCAPVNLTDFKVNALRADPAGEYIQGDTQVPGLGVRVRASGAAAYVVMKRLPGQAKLTRITLGRVGEITLQDAREKAREAISATRKGIRVNAVKRLERARISEAVADTGYPPDSFGHIAELYIRGECRALARGVEVEAIIRRRLLPSWGHQPLDELRRRDLTAVLDPVIAAGHTQAAHRLRGIAIRIVNFAVDRGDCELNYIASASRGRRRAGMIHRTRRDRVLDDREIRAIWLACDDAGWPYRDFVRLALLLGQRREEIAAMEWQELDLGPRPVWTIPASRYKTKVEHAVPLSSYAVELISALPRLATSTSWRRAQGAASGASRRQSGASTCSRVSAAGASTICAGPCAPGWQRSGSTPMSPSESSDTSSAVFVASMIGTSMSRRSATRWSAGRIG